MKPGEAEAVVDALAQNAPQLLLPLQHHHVGDPFLVELHRGGQAGGAAAHHHHVHMLQRQFLHDIRFHHSASSRTFP